MAEYKLNEPIAIEEVIELYRSAGLPRPIDDRSRMEQMYAGSNLVVSAWENDRLVGVARSICDGVWSCYLADLAVDPEYQRSGVGRRLVEITREAAGEGSMVLLLSVPGAMDYYPRIGMSKVENGFIFNRKY
jgi:ribosomal protein S18 acetylase RimI-like enzyme